RRVDLYLNAVPLAVAHEVRWAGADRVLMTQFESDFLKNVVHLSATAWIKNLVTRNAGEFVEDRLPFHSERTPDITAAQNSNRVKHHIGFFQDATQLVESVTRVIVLSVANQQQRAFRMHATLHPLDAKVAGIVKRSVVL